MANKIFFATRNKDKVKDLNLILGSEFDVKSILDLNIDLDTVEDSKSFEGNSFKKARELFDIVKMPVIADDSGLLIEKLNGFPGVNSNRWYKGQADNWKDINLLLLKKLKEEKLMNIADRKACFKTVITYIDENSSKQFEGIINGTIAFELKGKNGFGYSPIFIKCGDKLTQAEVSDEERANSSHRSIAIKSFLKWYKEEK